MSRSGILSDPARLLPVIILAAWVLVCTGFLIAAWDKIGMLDMPDPDDSMRLLQIRDWLAGQNWFDVTQYRLNPPTGYQMHWSRFVDMPIAGLILALTPFVGRAVAEMIACAIMPLILLGGVMTMLTLAARRLGGFEVARFVPFFVICAPLVLFHSMPLRIDHHGWQLLCGATTFWALFDRDPRRSGLIAGAAGAMWLHISLESLPMVSAIAGLLGLRWVLAPEHGVRLVRFMAAITVGSVLLYFATHGPSAWGAITCDSMAFVHLSILGVGAAGLAIAVPLTCRNGLPIRLAVTAVLGAVAAAIYMSAAPICAKGPFATLDPLVRDFWYHNVLEGRPIWDQKGGIQLMLLYPLLGLPGYLLAWLKASDAQARRNWATALLLSLAALGVAFMVQRAGAYATLLALPGCAVLADRLLRRARRMGMAVPRVVATVGAVVLLSPLPTTWAGAAMLADANGAGKVVAAKPTPGCDAMCIELGAIGRLPASYILAPLDLGPMLLLHTPHSALASGYHRNSGPMRQVISVFIGPPELARRLMREKGMRYLLIGPEASEALLYSEQSPNGLMARLRDGRVPGWLEPVPIGPSRYRLWRLKDGPTG